jgi:hypothetical protein
MNVIHSTGFKLDKATNEKKVLDFTVQTPELERSHSMHGGNPGPKDPSHDIERRIVLKVIQLPSSIRRNTLTNHCGSILPI